MLRMLEAQAPAKQTATDTISTLSSRLNNATLLEDRRAAILGLRSFAKDHPASVASGSLRGLIGCLAKDLEDVDTIKSVLETLLMLFNPNPDSPEAGDEIALWLADEFTQRQDNIKILLNLLETIDFYCRLYSLQLLTAIFAARPERTQECVLSAALGTSRLVATLDDPRDPIRNAGLLLLADLTQSSTELQKLVAFEGAFDRVFQRVESEGGLSEGGIVVQDCLDLLANLVRQNSSNQSLFRESGCVQKLSTSLKTAYVVPEGEDISDNFPNSQRDKNLWGLLAVIRLFLVNGSVGTNVNQKTFEKHGLLQQVLELAFRGATDGAIRSEALYTCGDIIRANSAIQAGFAQFQVPLTVQPEQKERTNGTANGITKVYVIDALLDTVLASPTSQFNVRLAACECIKSYFAEHTQIRLHFLNRAIEGHTSGADETANILTALLHEGADQVSDPYRIWFAAVLLLHLIWDDSEAKATLMKVSEGDADSGEEVVTCIQTIAGNLIAGIQRDEDERVSIAYLMLLSTILFETPPAVDDFLNEGSSLQALIQKASGGPTSSSLITGLSALLVGILYEYSTKDSPLPRRKLQPILTSGLGRERYLHALNQLRQHPFIRDYEVFEQGSAVSTSTQDLPPFAFFDSKFVELLKDNFSRFLRAIDRDPGIEIHVGSQEQGIDRDLVDSLRSQLEEKSAALQKTETKMLELEQKVDTAQANHRKEIESSTTELQRLRQDKDILQQNHEATIKQLESTHTSATHQLQSTLNAQVQDLQRQLETAAKAASDEAERTKEYYERALSQARTGKINVETRLAKLQEDFDEASKTRDELQNTLKEVQDENKSWKRAIDSLKAASEKKDKQLKDQRERLEKELRDLRDKHKQETKEAQDKATKDAQAARDQAQKELTQTQKGSNEVLKQLRDKLTKENEELKSALKSQKETAEDENTKVAMLEKEVSDLETSAKKDKIALEKAQKEAKDNDEARGKLQTELDDLFLMLQDIEEKRNRDKKRLKDHGEIVSDDDEDEEEADEDDDDDDDEDDRNSATSDLE